jgi:hypothetical protein
VVVESKSANGGRTQRLARPDGGAATATHQDHAQRQGEYIIECAMHHCFSLRCVMQIRVGYRMWTQRAHAASAKLRFSLLRDFWVNETRWDTQILGRAELIDCTGSFGIWSYFESLMTGGLVSTNIY